jgi:hypothetical protein
MKFTLLPERIRPVSLEDYVVLGFATAAGSILLIILALGFIGWMFNMVAG